MGGRRKTGRGWVTGQGWLCFVPQERQRGSCLGGQGEVRHTEKGFPNCETSPSGNTEAKRQSFVGRKLREVGEVGSDR